MVCALRWIGTRRSAFIIDNIVGILGCHVADAVLARSVADLRLVMEADLPKAALETERVSSAHRAAEIAAVLEEDVALGHLRPRERLLEDELARRFAAKRHVIRMALATLTDMGVIVHQANKGAAVREFELDEVEQLYQVRELVERRAAELIPLPAPEGLIRQLTAIHARHTAAVAKDDLRLVFRHNLLFHRVLFAACGNLYLVGVVEQFAMRTHAIRSYTIGDRHLLARVCQEHAAMIACLEKADRGGLVRTVVDHLRPAKDAYLARTRVLMLSA
jgi:DNA-binding GntR family transcriptional regulator